MCTLAFILWAIFGEPETRILSVVATAMAPTLVIGDYVLVASAYGAGGNAPARGDIAMFQDPHDPSTLQLFRVIGLPGDVVQMIGGVAHLNGAALEDELLGDYALDDGMGGSVVATRYREALPEGRSYEILDAKKDFFLDDTAAFNVPPGDYFVLGDNRDNAADSRTGRMGFVPRKSFIGRVERILCSRSEVGAIRQDRILKVIE